VGPRRLLLALVVAIVAATTAVAASRESAAEDGGAARGPRAAAAIAQPPPRPTAYERARRHGGAIAILRRPTVLRATPNGRRIATLRRRTEFRSPRVLAAVGERRGWLRVVASELPNGRSGWIRTRAARVSATPWSVRADLSRRTVTVRRDGAVVRRFVVSIGRPSTPTPVGRYAVTDKLRVVGGSRAYGWGVLALSGHQPHIEPGWPGGDRLAIHGSGSPGAIGDASSFGCLRAREADVRWLVRHVWLGSPVEIAP
jgi:lipoprotein-anchoring transpeptidase ErfK/SrfK